MKRDLRKFQPPHRNLDKLARMMGTWRYCMCCSGGFTSVGIHNRLCAKCRTRTEREPFQFTQQVRFR